ncbi:MAG: TolC family protein [Acidobacteriota bacterium]
MRINEQSMESTGIFLKRKIIFLLLIFLFILNLKPDEIFLNKDSELKDYLAYSALKNPGLEAAFNKWKASVEKITRVKVLPDALISFSYYIKEIETKTGPQEQKLGILQKFPWFGKLGLKSDAAGKTADAFKQIFEQKKLNVFFKVKKSYYEYYYISRAFEVIKKNIHLLRNLEEVVRTKYSTGETSHSSLIRIQIELDKLQDRLSTFSYLKRPLRTLFNSALNRPFDSKIFLPERMKGKFVKIGHQLLTKWIKEANPGLKAAEKIIEREKIGIKLAKKNYFPDLSLGLDYIFTGESDVTGVPDSGKNPLIARISFNLPFHFGKLRSSVREAAARFRSVKKEKEEKENSLLSKMDMVYFKLRDQGRKISLYGDTLIPKSKLALEVTRSAFTSGKVEFIDMIDSLRTLFDLELLFERAKTSYLQHIAELEMMTGKEFSRYKTNSFPVLEEETKQEKQHG